MKAISCRFFVGQYDPCCHDDRAMYIRPSNFISMSERVRNMRKELLSDNWYTLNKVIYEYRRRDGSWETQQREAYDRGNGAAILLYHPVQRTVILTRQFRMPTYLNGNTEGMLIEVPAGLLDQDAPEDCIRRETEEETGYVVRSVRKAFEVYMSPGSVTEILHLFVAEYDHDMRRNDGGGVAHEQEEIEVLELPFEEALRMMATGEIRDGKTLILLQYAALQGLLK
jgi:GDP-mannose pyrophosphatase NudK